MLVYSLAEVDFSLRPRTMFRINPPPPIATTVPTTTAPTSSHSFTVPSSWGEQFDCSPPGSSSAVSAHDL